MDRQHIQAIVERSLHDEGVREAASDLARRVRGVAVEQERNRYARFIWIGLLVVAAVAGAIELARRAANG